MIALKQYFNDFVELFYPELCIICNKGEKEIENAFCMECYAELPFTDQAYYKDNEFIAHFKGKIQIEHGAAIFYFSKNSSIQGVIQKLKYKGMSHYGVLLGKVMGEIIKKSPYYKNVDVIIPVPIHKEREKERGYNQSLMLALGINKELEIDIAADNLIRIKNTATQTKMSREERIENLKNAFQLKDSATLEGKHILIVDDVLTTGSTLLECAHTLMQVPGVSLSFVTLAMGEIV